MLAVLNKASNLLLVDGELWEQLTEHEQRRVIHAEADVQLWDIITQPA